MSAKKVFWVLSWGWLITLFTVGVGATLKGIYDDPDTVEMLKIVVPGILLFSMTIGAMGVVCDSGAKD